VKKSFKQQQHRPKHSYFNVLY